MEGNLVLTGSTGGRRNGLKTEQRPRERRLWTSGTAWPGCWDTAATPACCQKLIFTVPLASAPGSRDKVPVRSIHSDCRDPAWILVAGRWGTGRCLPWGFRTRNWGFSMSPTEQYKRNTPRQKGGLPRVTDIHHAPFQSRGSVRLSGQDWRTGALASF